MAAAAAFLASPEAAYITGETDSFDYPLVAAFEGAPVRRQFTSFVSTLSNDGSALTFSSYLHAGSAPFVAARVDSSARRSIYVAGATGVGAQTTADSGGFINPFPRTATGSRSAYR